MRSLGSRTASGHSPRRVGAAIIDGDDLEIGEALVGQALQRFFEIARGIA